MFTYRDYYDIITSYDKIKLYLRHDVDISPKKAAEMAEREYKIGIGPACYFILLSSEFYNPFDEDNRKRISQILDMGHKIGLHYDLSKYKGKISNAEHIAWEANMLGQAFDVDIVAISCHNPAMGEKPTYEMLSKLQAIGLNDPNFTLRGYKYISDSGMNFRDDPYEAIKYHTQIHLNIHPEWWAEKEGNYQDRLQSLRLDLDMDRKINKHLEHLDKYRSLVKNESKKPRPTERSMAD